MLNPEKCSTGVLVEWIARERQKSTPQNDYDLLIKFVVDRATFFILSTPPLSFRPPLPLLFAPRPCRPRAHLSHSHLLKAPEALSGAQCRRKERRGGVRSELELLRAEQRSAIARARGIRAPQNSLMSSRREWERVLNIYLSSCSTVCTGEKGVWWEAG